MNLLLAAINAKYIHSSLALYSLKAYAKEYAEHIQVTEYTINQRKEMILQDLYCKKPDVLFLSCYIWNFDQMKSIISSFHKILPQVPVWVGGPEVSYDVEEVFSQLPMLTGVIWQEGEKVFKNLASYYIKSSIPLSEIRGIAYRDHGKIRKNEMEELLDLSEIPFCYDDLSSLQNRILYYESSRGCPFSCSYCLSSVERGVRFRSLDLVRQELQFFLDRRVPQVKFVDRTFNCSHTHTLEIWRYIHEHDNGFTNFHFEIAGDLLNEEELRLLSQMRPGLVQLEVGVQSTNQKTILEIDRSMDLGVLCKVITRIQGGRNVHLHLDLIAGLPFEDFDSFVCSFNEVYRMEPHQLQLGFLKLLKGSKMRRNAGEYGMVYPEYPPYEILYTRWISYQEILILKGIEEMVEVYYNSRQFAYTIDKLIQVFASPFAMFLALSEFYQKHNPSGQNHSRITRMEILRSFAAEYDLVHASLYEELLLLDLYLRENLKSRPQWAPDLSAKKQEIADFYRKETDAPEYLTGYDGYNYRQRMNMTHLEIFTEDVLGSGRTGGYWVLFDYRRRDPLTGNAVYFILQTNEKL